MKSRVYWIMVFVVVIGLVPSLIVHDIQAEGPFDDLTPNQYTFVGRRGATYTATWDLDTYEVRISTPDGTFPWDWVSFVGTDGAVALGGLHDLDDIFVNATSGVLSGAEPGDIVRVKGRDILSLAHLTKLGLVIGTGASAQRAWFSDGTITEYILAPHYVGYQAQVLGRSITVRLSNIAPAPFDAVGVIEIALDNPSDARLLIASDLEPALEYSPAAEFRNVADTVLSFDPAAQAVVGHATLNTQEEVSYGQPVPAYLYSSNPLHSWSANNLSFASYLSADTLDGQIAGGTSDGQVAISTVAQPLQYFYIGFSVLDIGTRADPALSMNALRDERLAALAQLPTIDALDLPAFKFINFVSNLFNAYLINPNERIYYTDKTVVYSPDTLMAMNVAPELLPDLFINAFQDMTVGFGASRYTSPSEGRYWWKADVGNNWPLPSWYAGNIPDIYSLLPDGRIARRWQFSDVYSSAEYITALASLYRVTGDLAYVQAQEAALDDTLAALKTFDSAYDAEFGEDGDLFPNLVVPMADLATIQGVYPAETGHLIYAYEDAAFLFEDLGRVAEAEDLLDNYVAPMRTAYDGAFWSSALGYYAPLGDERSSTKAAGAFYFDKWCATLIIPIMRDLGDNRLAEMLATYTAGGFYEPTGDVHWLSTDSENFAWRGRWGLAWGFTNGFDMHGGFYDGIPPVLPPIGFYQLGQTASGDQYANIYLDRWATMGPYEAMMEWYDQIPGRFWESSLYIEPTIATTWLFKEAMGLHVEGTVVIVEPRLGGQFVARNVRVTANGLSAVFDYARDASGQEYIQIISNEGLTVVAPNVSGDNDAPVVSGIPDQTINQGQSFTAINLDDYVTDDDNTNAQMTWTYSGNISLTVSIDANRVATITAPSSSWSGSEEITFTAEDPGAESDSDSATFTVRPRHSLTLQPGWNMVSFNLQPVSTVITDVLSSIDGDYDLVYAWDASVSSDNWKLYDDTSGQPNPTLSTLNEKQGFWIHITALSAVALDVDGTAPGTTLIRLHTEGGNWNLVGYPAAATGALPGVLKKADDSAIAFSLVYAYHANDTSNPWKLYDTSVPAWANDLNGLYPGWGYWIKVGTDDQDWSLDY